MEKETKTSTRPGMADELNSNLYAKLESMAKWLAPCTFRRTERAPIDSKSCFISYEDLMSYINDPYSTAYPGMLVSVTSSIEDDNEFGAYVLKSAFNENSGVWELTPSPAGMKSLVVGGLDGAQTYATIDRYGNAAVSLGSLLSGLSLSSHKHTSSDITDIGNYVTREDLESGIEFDSLTANSLTVDGKDVSLVGHKHVVSDIDDLNGLWSIPGAEAAATTATQKIEAATNIQEIKDAMIEFLSAFKRGS